MSHRINKIKMKSNYRTKVFQLIQIKLTIINNKKRLINKINPMNQMMIARVMKTKEQALQIETINIKNQTIVIVKKIKNQEENHLKSLKTMINQTKMKITRMIIE